MKNPFKNLILLISLSFACLSANAQCGNLYIEGAIDGDLSGGLPKGIQLCANADIADLSIYGIESVSNGGGSNGVEEYTLPADGLLNGECIWIASETSQFNSFFGFDPCYTSGQINSNGDDSYILYCSGTASDVAGDPDTDGTGQTWEYMDGWLHASDAVPNATFTDTEWTYSGPNALDGESTNSGATTPYPNVSINCPAQLPTISIDDVSLIEGNTGTSVMTFTVTLSSVDAADITFDYVTSDGSATTGDSDYVEVTAGSGTITATNLTTTIDITINGDTNIEMDESFMVTLSNISANATISDGIGEGTIEDDDTPPIVCESAGDIIITEIMQNPDAVGDSNGEFVEILNTTASAIDINGWELADAGGESHIITNGGPLIVPANGYFILGRNGDMGTNGGISVDYVYSGFFLGNGDDEVILNCDPLGTPTLIDEVAYDGGTMFPDPSGASMSLNPNNLDHLQNDIGANWCESTTPFGSGDLGTPGLLNDCTMLPSISIDDVSIVEGDAGTSVLSFTVTLSSANASDVTFDINTADGTATVADNDYVAIVSGTGTITASALTTTIDVTINGDTNIESDEEFDVILSNVSANALILDNAGTGTISDDDTPTPEIILISEIAVCDQQVELYNAGTTTVDISNWRLCKFPDYDDLGDATAVTIISGSLNLAPGSYVTVQWPSIDVLAGEIGLYLPSGGFGDPANIKDYVQYNSSNNQRASVAVTAGVWDDAALDVLAPTNSGCATIIANATLPSSSNSTTWCISASSTINPAASNSSCSTGIICPSAGDIIVSEIMQNPIAADDNLGEYFELYNITGADIDIDGWQISDAGADSHIISNGGPLIVPSNGYIILSINDDMLTNGGLTVDYEYSGITLSNSDDEIFLSCDPAGANLLIDAVAYDGGTAFPDPSGASMNLNPNNLNGVDNDSGSNWCTSTSVYGDGDLGTPGATNDVCASPPQLSIDDVAISEGNSGTTIFTFTVSTPTSDDLNDITFDINTADGTATEPSDYTAIVGGTGTITATMLSTTIDVVVNGDMDIEANETFDVIISNVSANATILDGLGTGTINDDDDTSGCPNDYAGPNALTGTISGTEDYETNGIIESTQIIGATGVVDYDSALEITLNAGFETTIGALFSAFIDGCGGSQ